MQKHPACGAGAGPKGEIGLGSQEGTRGPGWGSGRAAWRRAAGWALKQEGFGPGRLPVAGWGSIVVR